VLPRLANICVLALKSHSKGHFMRDSRKRRRIVPLVGMAVLGLALAGIAAKNLAAAPESANPSCMNSTNSIKQLAVIDNSSDGIFQCLSVSLDGDTIRALRIETHKIGANDQGSDPDQIKIEEFSKAVVESPRGAVLDGVPGHDAIILRGHLAAPQGRSELVTSYLYNGFTGEYRHCQITLNRTPDKGWRLINQRDQVVSHIVVKTRQMPLLGTFGIANLEGACT
jgi:hypothetical protein